jgi:NAD(P)H-dependent FMN reductase
MRTLGSKMKVIAFAASSSKQSINKQLVTYASGLVENAQVEVLDLNDYERFYEKAVIIQPCLTSKF